MSYLVFEAIDRLGRFAFVLSRNNETPEWPGLRLRAIGAYRDKNAAIAGLLDLLRRQQLPVR